MVHPLRPEDEPCTDGGVRTAGQARAVARGFLAVAVPHGGDAAEAVLLVVSELFTNAVRHAGGATGFHLAAAPDAVTVQVQDASPDPPRRMRPDPLAPGGFGWHLVQELSRRVHVEVHPAGKTVTAIVPCRTALRPR